MNDDTRAGPTGFADLERRRRDEVRQQLLDQLGEVRGLQERWAQWLPDHADVQDKLDAAEATLIDALEQLDEEVA